MGFRRYSQAKERVLSSSDHACKCSSLSCGEDLIDVLDRDVLSADLLSSLVELHLELEAVLGRVNIGEGVGNHSGVGEEDAVEGQTGALDGMLVHFLYRFLIII